MIGAIVVAFLAGMPAYILVTSAHLKGKTQLALSNVFGAILLILWKSITDDGAVNKLETTIMMALFGLMLYFLAVHG